jgi:hypothetical protein
MPIVSITIALAAIVAVWLIVSAMGGLAKDDQALHARR